MNRYGVAALVGCLYVAGSVWIVRSQGEAYRDGLRRQKLAAEQTPTSTPHSGDGEATAPVAAMVPEPARPPRPEPPVTPAPTAPGASSARPAEGETAPAPPPA